MNNYSQLFGQNGSIKLRPKAFCTVDVIRLVVSLTHRNITVNSTRPYTHTHTHTHGRKMSLVSPTSASRRSKKHKQSVKDIRRMSTCAQPWMYDAQCRQPWSRHPML